MVCVMQALPAYRQDFTFFKFISQEGLPMRNRKSITEVAFIRHWQM